MVQDSDHGKNVPNSLNRRNFLRATSGAVVATSAVGFAGADEGGDERIEGEVPYPDRSTIRVDESLKSVTPYYYLLTLDKDRVLELIDKSDRDAKKRDEHRAFLKDIWSKFPVKSVQKDGDIVYSLANENGKVARMDDDEEKNLSAAAQAVGRGYAKESQGGDVSAQWFANSHETMSTHTLENFDFYDYEITDIASHAPDPDSDPCPECTDLLFYSSWDMPNWVRDEIAAAMNKLARHYNHYYDPTQYSSTMAGVDIDFAEIGAAPWACKDQMTKAENDSYSARREYLGRALHYCQDVGNPLHTGMGLEQVNFGLNCDSEGCAAWDPRKEMHAGYERYINQNLTSGENFIIDYDSMIIYNSDPVSVIKNCADRTNEYSYELYHLMMDNGNDVSEWTDSDAKTRVKEITRNSLTYAGGYTYALVDQLY